MKAPGKVKYEKQQFLVIIHFKRGYSCANTKMYPKTVKGQSLVVEKLKNKNKKKTRKK